MKDRTFVEYSELASQTIVYPKDLKVIYPVLGLCGEVGEAADKIKKVIRDHGGVFTSEAKREIAKELGDALWYINATCRDLDITLEEVALLNLRKISDRKARGTIHGEGDNR